jgi:hypothetical protein
MKSEPQSDLDKRIIELLSLQAEVGRLEKLKFGSQFPREALTSTHEKFPVCLPTTGKGLPCRRRLVSRNQYDG